MIHNGCKWIFIQKIIVSIKISLNWSFHLFILRAELLKVIAPLVAVAAIFVKIVWFLKARFTCTVTSKIYYVKGELDRNSCNTMYIAECSKCKHQYIGSALNFKQQVMIYRSDIKTNKSWSNKFSSFTSTDQSKFSVTMLIRTSKLFCWSTNSNNNCIRNLCKRFFHKQLSCSSLGLKNDQKFPSNFPASNFESC